MREKKHAQKQQKTNKRHTPQALQSGDVFWFLKLRSPTSPVFRSLIIGPNHIPSSRVSICHRKSDGATPKCRAKDASCVFLSPNQELPSGQRALGKSPWKRLHEDLFFWDDLQQNLDFTKLWDGIGIQVYISTNLFEKLRIPYRTWDSLWYVWLGAKLQNFTKTPSLLHPPAERFPAGWWWVGDDLATKKTYDPKNPNRFLL